jgi:hypothetical protein
MRKADPVKMTIEDGLDGLADLVFPDPHAPSPRAWRVTGLTQHDLNDIEAVLAARKAMARTCPAEDGDHTCGLPPGHPPGHQCRACPREWL